MDLGEYATLDATSLAAHVRAGDLAPDEPAALAAAAAAAVDPALAAVVEVYDEPSRRPLRDDALLPGVPTLRKDTTPEAGRLHERGSRLAQGVRATTTGHVVERVLDEGARVVGRSAVPELAILSSTESALHGTTRNPWSPDATAGGSSGGAAAAVAAGVVPFALASDGGGSIRIPASCCGLVGLKPSRGLVSPGPGRAEHLFGIAVENVVTRTVRDTALLLDVLAARQPGDPFAAWPRRSFRAAIAERQDRLRIAVSAEPWAPRSDVDPEVAAATLLAASTLGSLGHRVQERRPHYDSATAVATGATYFALGVAAEVTEIALATGRPADTGADDLADLVEPVALTYVRTAERLGAADVLAASEGRALVRWQVERFFDDVDVLVTPTLQVLPPPHGTGNLTAVAPAAVDHWSALEQIHPNLSIFNLTGHPAVSVPVGTSASGLPIGVQLVGRRGSDDVLLRLALALEQELPWAGRRPPVHVTTAAAVTEAAR
ncbi:amidase [Pimelobacter simplex]|uniref:amidase n=1 Tax=Nocardioides simplex TaxID=2045 RepID=UPI003AAF7934